MELPRGITGFRHYKDAPPPVCDVTAFRRNSYAAARALNGRVVAVTDPGHRVETNFARAELEFPTGRIVVLLNAHFPMIAFAEPPADGKAEIRFTDSLALAEAFRDFGTYEVLQVSDLAEPLTPELYHRLAPAEREQIEYWQPRNVGDVVFNFWD